MSKPTVVIVPGSWQKPIVWDGFRAVLLAGLADDVAALRHVLEPLIEHQGQDVVLLCHSSGGVVGSNAVEGLDAPTRRADGKTGGAVRVAFLSAFMLPRGMSLLDMFGGTPAPWMVVEGDRVTGNPELFPEVEFNDLSPDEQVRWSKEATHTWAALFGTPSGYEPWAGGMPCAYIVCEDDRALPPQHQRGMALLLGPEPRAASAKSGHRPFLSVPKELLRALEKVC
ncbi:hypothetical protein B0T25DRAFT_589210 [Lasiosphaeria hispida]|uniref:AB hydrolase-1 domain-containing protein n=1 Tax=Lasiosphaeria hispida TaxID=260671 RepID=A0AAJ0HKP4_9PEZI|nr:hypothetical protein B0T25DRAFT_589210 [Lasiosphaeria hispida]